MPGAGNQGPAGTLIAGILLAAGGSQRYGKQKLLESWDGEPLVRHSARAFVEAGMAPVLVVIADPDVRLALTGLAVELVENPERERGISHSIGLAIRRLPADAPAVALGVADQPLLSAELVGQLARAFRPGVIVAPRYGRTLGNPRIFDRRFFPELLELSGDTGGQAVVGQHPEALVEVQMAEGLGIDVDRPADWSRLPRR